MVTDQDVRTIALSLPGAEEKAHFGRPDFRVNNKIFATLRSALGCVVVKLSVADQSALVAMNPDTFAVNSWSHPGWTNIALKGTNKEEVRKALQAAWRNVAPKKLIAASDANDACALAQQTAARDRVKKRGA